MKRKKEKKENEVPQKIPKLGLKLLEILLIGKEKKKFKLETCTIEKEGKHMFLIDGTVLLNFLLCRATVCG